MNRGISIYIPYYEYVVYHIAVLNEMGNKKTCSKIVLFMSEELVK